MEAKFLLNALNRAPNLGVIVLEKEGLSVLFANDVVLKAVPDTELNKPLKNVEFEKHLRKAIDALFVCKKKSITVGDVFYGFEAEISVNIVEWEGNVKAYFIMINPFAIVEGEELFRRDRNFYIEAIEFMSNCYLQFKQLSNGDLEIYNCNRASTDFFGMTKGVLLESFNKEPESFFRSEYEFLDFRKRIKTCIESDQLIETELVILGAENSHRWIDIRMTRLVDENDEIFVQAEFNDITDKKSMELALKEEVERYRLALESTSDVIFEYIPEDDVLYTYGNIWDDSISKSVVSAIGEFKQNLLEGKVVEFCDIKNVVDFFEIDNVTSVEARFLTNNLYNESSHWFRLEGSPIIYKGKFVKLIGRFVDIHKSKNIDAERQMHLAFDKKTGLLSKSRGIEIVKDILAKNYEDGKHYLMLASIDRFKFINDKYSYVVGDTILESISKLIKRQFSNEDVSMRFSGDKFLILFDAESDVLAGARVETFSKSVKNVFSEDFDDINISASIGYASNKTEGEYSSVLDKAIRAVLIAKSNGLGNFCFFDSASEEEKLNCTKELLDDMELENVDELFLVEENSLVSSAMDILEKSKDFNVSMKILLAKIGEQFCFDRITVIETDISYAINSITFQWLGEGINVPSENGKIFHFKNSDAIEKLNEFYADDGMFVCDDEIIDKLPVEMKKVLKNSVKNNAYCFAIYDGGKVIGTIVYEKFEGSNIINDMDIMIIKAINKVISTHIVKNQEYLASKAKSVLISRLSQDIRNPMNAIFGMTVLLKKNIDGVIKKCVDADDAQNSSIADAKDNLHKTRKYIEELETSSKYLLSLFNDFLEISQVGNEKISVSKTTFDLEELISGLSAVINQYTEEKEINFDYVFSVSDTRLVGDALKLNQVLINLLNNAIKFTPAGGRVFLGVHQLYNEDNSVVIQFSVMDSGVGINPERLPNIFKDFGSTSTESGSISGMGLPICSNIVKMLGGVLEVESVEDEGSEFFFTLKFDVAPAEEKTYDLDKEEYYDFEKRRILIVEDNAVNAEIITTILEMANCKVDVETSVEGGIARLKDRPKQYYSAVVFDVEMPNKMGYELAGRVKAFDMYNNTKTPMLAICSAQSNILKKQLSTLNINHIVAKPIEMEVLYQELWNAIIEEQ